jgi:transposase InsO family protein
MNKWYRAKLNPYSRELLVKRALGDWATSDAASAAGVSLRTAYKWLARYRAEGVAGLANRSCRPKRLARQKVDGQLGQRIEELRRQRLKCAAIAERTGLSRATVARHVRRLGLSRLSALDPRPPVIRYERERPGDLLHIDIKKLGGILRPGHRATGNRADHKKGAGWEYVHVCVDDHSRLSYVEMLPDERQGSAVGFLERAVAWLGRHGVSVSRVMTDNGAAYGSRLFAASCRKLGVKHLFTKPYTPRTNGKAERFIQTSLREWAYARTYSHSRERAGALPAWLAHYNYCRSHSALGGRPPISRILGPVNKVLRLDS